MTLNTTASAGLSNQMKVTYDRRLLERTRPRLVHTKFAQQRPIPRRGGKTIEFRRFASLPTATEPLTEGVPPTLKSIESTSITATIEQYGDAVGFTDLVSTTTIDPILVETTDILADQAADTIDEVNREILNSGTNVQYAGGNTQQGDIEAGDVLTVDEIRLAVLALKLGRARPIDGAYQALIHPRTTHDLMGTEEWVTANHYAGSQRIFDGSLGMLYGVKFWESDVTKVFEGEGVEDANLYSSLFFGANAWGMVRLGGHNLQTFYKPLGSAGTADPINQQQTMGWKVAFTARILNDAFMVRVVHGASTDA